MDHFPKSRPGAGDIIRFERGDCEGALLFEIRIGLSEGVAVKVILIVTNQCKQSILAEIRGDDNIQRTVAETPRERVARNLDMNVPEHPSIIS